LFRSSLQNGGLNIRGLWTFPEFEQHQSFITTLPHPLIFAKLGSIRNEPRVFVPRIPRVGLSKIYAWPMHFPRIWAPVNHLFYSVEFRLLAEVPEPFIIYYRTKVLWFQLSKKCDRPMQFPRIWILFNYFFLQNSGFWQKFQNPLSFIIKPKFFDSSYQKKVLGPCIFPEYEYSSTIFFQNSGFWQKFQNLSDKCSLGHSLLHCHSSSKETKTSTLRNNSENTSCADDGGKLKPCRFPDLIWLLQK
jgi:hypothetical protein